MLPPFCLASFAAALTAALFLSGAFLGYPARAASKNDGFIATIESMKHSVTALVCVAGYGSNSTVVDRTGSAFFLSPSGAFLTASHIIRKMQDDPPACPTSAITIPVDRWRPETAGETLMWFPFSPSQCQIDAGLDVARCQPDADLSIPRRGLNFQIRPVEFEWSIPPDGTEVAFTGFPLALKDPMTSRAGIATYWTVMQEGRSSSELILDRPAWPGSSGSPVYLSDGKVIGILLDGGTGNAAGTSILRPISLIKEILRKPAR